MPFRSIFPLRFALTLAIVLTSITSVKASDPWQVVPEGPRITSLQTPEAFFGFPIGSRHLRHDQVVAYWRYLAQQSDRVSLIPYGKTHGQRPLLVAVISSASNLTQLDAIQDKRPRLTSGNYQDNLQDELLVMYMGYSVHGDEASAVNAAPLIAYHLASSESETVKQWLDASLFMIDPALNPDGVDRFANWANEARGRFPSASSIDREHVQAWPGGRTNYYWFDLNRDWLPTVHPESQGRLKLFHQWKPNVVLDFHEMGGTSSYFFQPGIPARNNPLSPAKNLELTRKFAVEHAKSLDDAEELYYTEERFDDFYPGKGSTYPDLHGAVGILFEQGSTRGLQLKNEATDRHFQDTVANQVRTSLSSLQAAHRYRAELLEFQTEFYNDALQSGTNDVTTAYIVTGSSSRIAAAAALLDRHAIETYVPTTSIRVDDSTYAPGAALVIPCAQAEYPFICSLMEPMQSFRENIFYDVSTWHLPSALDLDMHRFQFDLPEAWTAKHWQPRTATSLPKSQTDTPGISAQAEPDQSIAGFAFSPLELSAPRLAAVLQQAGASLRVATKAFTTEVNGQIIQWPPGTYLVLKQPNRAAWQPITTTLNSFAAAHDIQVAPITSGLTPSGPDLGSNTTLILPKCNPLLVVGTDTSAYEAGGLWHFLDHRLEQPATLVDSARLSGLDLHDYTCLILPGGAYSDWSQTEANHLLQYVRGGGTVIACTSSINWLEKVDILKSDAQAEDTAASAPAAVAGPMSFESASNDRALESIAGAFFMVSVDPTHPLAFGLPNADVPVFRDHSYRFAPPSNPYKTVARYAGVIAGYVSATNRSRLHDSAAVWVEPLGRGKFIMLADNPVFRGYVRSSERFLTNAILLGPVLDIPAPPRSLQAPQDDGHGHGP